MVFPLAIKNFKSTFHDLIELTQAPMKYLLTYKFSQDHLDLFFCAIRAAGGYKNPTTQQFTASCKFLLMKSSIEGGTGNCHRRDPRDILRVFDDTCKTNNQYITLKNAALIRKYDLSEKMPILYDHDYRLLSILPLAA